MKWARAGALLLLFFASISGSTIADDTGAFDRSKLGEFVPASQPFPVPGISLADPAGTTVEIADFRGKLLLVNFWATWCEPCLREMPSLERLQSRLGDRIAVLAVSEDRAATR